jgi:hypothetical protein
MTATPPPCSSASATTRLTGTHRVFEFEEVEKYAATRLLLRYAFDVIGLHRVELEVYDFTARAVASYLKCGFVEEGRKRDALRWDGQWRDALLMAALRTDNI